MAATTYHNIHSNTLTVEVQVTCSYDGQVSIYGPIPTEDALHNEPLLERFLVEAGEGHVAFTGLEAGR